MRAEEIRALSESMNDSGAKAIMRRIAADYDRLAERAQLDAADSASNRPGIDSPQQGRELSGTMVALEQVNLWLHTALENMVHGLTMFDKHQRLILCNDRYREIYGHTPDRIKPGMTLRSIIKSRKPEETNAHIENRIRTILSSESSHAETKLPDGRIIAMDFRAMPDGGWVGIHQDITERKHAEEYQKLLISELDHRVKNILARVAMVAKYTSVSSRTIDGFMRALDSRIQSMADAHTLLSQRRWRGVDIADLASRQLAPYATKTNTVIDGPHIILSPAATQALAMVLHELATNAVKHGSLSTPRGKVSVTWDRRVGEDGVARVAIAWRESGGPPVAGPGHSGYGTNLIRNLIPHELGGTTDLVFASEGICCEIEILLK